MIAQQRIIFHPLISQYTQRKQVTFMDSRSSTTINTDGGTVINDAVALQAGDFIGRDQIINVIVLIPPGPVGKAGSSQGAEAATPSNLHLLNFGRPFTAEQRLHIEELVSRPIGTMIEVTVHFDESRAFAAQCVTLLDRLALSRTAWQTLPILVNLPGYTPGAACLLGELHGRMGHFPTIVRLTPLPSTSPQEYAVAEIINLQAARNAALKRK